MSLGMDDPSQKSLEFSEVAGTCCSLIQNVLFEKCWLILSVPAGVEYRHCRGGAVDPALRSR